MSYAAREGSARDGAPVELYEFRRGSAFWRYTSAATDITYAAHTYSAAPISRSSIENAAEIRKTSLRVAMPRDLEVAQAFIPAPPSEVTLFTLYRQHRGDGETAVAWAGRVLNAEWRQSEVEFNCEPVYTSLQRTGLRRLYQRNCPHVLYGAACGVSAVAHRVTGTVALITGASVRVSTAAGYPAGHFAGGYMTWVSGGITEKRMITTHSADVVTLSGAPPGLAVGRSVLLYPGCDHVLNTCHTKFSNSVNFGGFPWIPTRNPFDSSPFY